MLTQDTTLSELKRHVETNGFDVNARLRNPYWYETSSGQYLALNIVAIIVYVTVWLTSWLFRMGSISYGIFVGISFYAVCELLHKRHLLGYTRVGATVRLVLFCMFVVRAAIWVKITMLVFFCVLIVAPAIYHGTQHRNLGEDNSALHLAAFFGCDYEIIKFLLEAGADVNARNSDLNTPLHFAVSDLNAVQLLLDKNADMDAENHKSERPLDLVKKPGIAQALLIAGARENAKWQSGHEVGSYRGLSALKLNVGKTLKPGESLCFLSHHKGDAASTAIFFHGVLCTRFKVRSNQIFLDSNSLEDLRNIIDLIKKTKVLVILQTKGVLVRPFCLAEMSTAISFQIPIVAINIDGQGYNYEDAAAFLGAPSFKEALEERNPGAAETLEGHGFNVDDLGQTLRSVIPNIISKPFNPMATERVRASQIDDIVEAIADKL